MAGQSPGWASGTWSAQTMRARTPLRAVRRPVRSADRAASSLEAHLMIDGRTPDRHAPPSSASAAGRHRLWTAPSPLSFPASVALPRAATAGPAPKKRVHFHDALDDLSAAGPHEPAHQPRTLRRHKQEEHKQQQFQQQQQQSPAMPCTVGAISLCVRVKTPPARVSEGAPLTGAQRRAAPLESRRLSGITACVPGSETSEATAREGLKNAAGAVPLLLVPGAAAEGKGTTPIALANLVPGSLEDDGTPAAHLASTDSETQDRQADEDAAASSAACASGSADDIVITEEQRVRLKRRSLSDSALLLEAAIAAHEQAAEIKMDRLQAAQQQAVRQHLQTVKQQRAVQQQQALQQPQAAQQQQQQQRAGQQRQSQQQPSQPGHHQQQMQGQSYQQGSRHRQQQQDEQQKQQPVQRPPLRQGTQQQPNEEQARDNLLLLVLEDMPARPASASSAARPRPESSARRLPPTLEQQLALQAEQWRQTRHEAMKARLAVLQRTQVLADGCDSLSAADAASAPAFSVGTEPKCPIEIGLSADGQSAKLFFNSSGTDGQSNALAYLAQFLQMSSTKLLLLRQVFEECDSDFDGTLFLPQVKKAVRKVNENRITAKETEYVVAILGISDSQRDTSGSPVRLAFPQFTVVALLSERVTALSAAVRQCILGMNLEKLEARYEQVVNMFYNADSERSGQIQMEVIEMELLAGRIDRSLRETVLGHLSSADVNASGGQAGIQTISFIDFLIYIPLFVNIHSDIVVNPFLGLPEDWRPAI